MAWVERFVRAEHWYEIHTYMSTWSAESSEQYSRNGTGMKTQGDVVYRRLRAKGDKKTFYQHEKERERHWTSKA